MVGANVVETTCGSGRSAAGRGAPEQRNGEREAEMGVCMFRRRSDGGGGGAMRTRCGCVNRNGGGVGKSVAGRNTSPVGREYHQTIPRTQRGMVTEDSRKGCVASRLSDSGGMNDRLALERVLKARARVTAGWETWRRGLRRQIPSVILSMFRALLLGVQRSTPGRSDVVPGRQRV